MRQYVPKAKSGGSSPEPPLNDEDGHTQATLPAAAAVSGDQGYHPVRVYHFSRFNDDIFASLWANGIPFVVEGLNDHRQLAWSPAYFIANHGQKTCVVQNCDTEEDKTISVASFFQRFGQYDDREDECLKLRVRECFLVCCLA